MDLDEINAMMADETSCELFGGGSNDATYTQLLADAGFLLDASSAAAGTGANTSTARANGFGSPDVDSIYAGLHRSVEHAVSQISGQKVLSLVAIKRHNRQIINRLASFELEVVHAAEQAFLGTSTNRDSVGSEASLGGLGANPPVTNSTNHRELRTTTAGSNTSLSSSSSASTSTVRKNSKRRRSVMIPRSSNNLVTDVQDNSSPGCAQGQHGKTDESDAHQLFSGFRGSASLALKVLQIGSEESVNQVMEFSNRLQRRRDHMQRQHQTDDDNFSTHVPSNTFQFPSMSQISNGAEFLRLLPNLASAIESNIFGEQSHRVKKRIALAHFYHAYVLAQENPEVFLSWCSEWHKQPQKSLLPKGGFRSIIQHRFSELMFPPAAPYAGDAANPGAKGLSRTPDNNTPSPALLKSRIGKIQSWRKIGKPWARLIKRFGYGILLLVPYNLTDEDLRVAHDDDMTALLDFVDSRKHLFSEALQQANELLRMQFFPSQRLRQLPTAPATPNMNTPNGSGLMFDSADTPDWDTFLSFAWE